MDFHNTQFYRIIDAGLKNEFIRFILFGGGLFAILRTILVLNGWRIFSFLRVYKNRERFLNHPVFYKIDRVLKGKSITNNIHDIAKKHLAEDIIFLEVFRIKQILKNNLKFIFKKNFRDYLLSFSDFTANEITWLFISEYVETKNNFETFARNKLTKNDYMTQEDFNRFYKVYTEFTASFEIYIYESLSIFPIRKNIYASIFGILDQFDVLIEIISKTAANKINLMNGRVDGVRYKGHAIGQGKNKNG